MRCYACTHQNPPSSRFCMNCGKLLAPLQQQKPLPSSTAPAEMGDYKLHEVLGEGGMGRVFRATHRATARDAAIKVLLPHFQADQRARRRLQREASTLRAAQHPNIVAFHEFLEVEGHSGLVMELLHGETLAERLQQGPFPVLEVLGIAEQVLTALVCAHGAGVIHRDLKPANIFLSRKSSLLGAEGFPTPTTKTKHSTEDLFSAHTAGLGKEENAHDHAEGTVSELDAAHTPSGSHATQGSHTLSASFERRVWAMSAPTEEVAIPLPRSSQRPHTTAAAVFPSAYLVKVMDFGVAGWRDSHMATTGGHRSEHPGTLPYMSPEQIQQRTAVEARSDLYALGTILYECLTGERWIAFDEPMAAIRQILTPRPLALSEELRAALPPQFETWLGSLLSVSIHLRPLDASHALMQLAHLFAHDDEESVVSSVTPLPERGALTPPPPTTTFSAPETPVRMSLSNDPMRWSPGGRVTQEHKREEEPLGGGLRLGRSNTPSEPEAAATPVLHPPPSSLTRQTLSPQHLFSAEDDPTDTETPSHDEEAPAALVSHASRPVLTPPHPLRQVPLPSHTAHHEAIPTSVLLRWQDDDTPVPEDAKEEAPTVSSTVSTQSTGERPVTSATDVYHVEDFAPPTVATPAPDFANETRPHTTSGETPDASDEVADDAVEHAVSTQHTAKAKASTAVLGAVAPSEIAASILTTEPSAHAKTAALLPSVSAEKVPSESSHTLATPIAAIPTLEAAPPHPVTATLMSSVPSTEHTASLHNGETRTQGHVSVSAHANVTSDATSEDATMAFAEAVPPSGASKSPGSEASTAAVADDTRAYIEGVSLGASATPTAEAAPTNAAHTDILPSAEALVALVSNAYAEAERTEQKSAGRRAAPRPVPDEATSSASPPSKTSPNEDIHTLAHNEVANAAAASVRASVSGDAHEEAWFQESAPVAAPAAEESVLVARSFEPSKTPIPAPTASPTPAAVAAPMDAESRQVADVAPLSSRPPRADRELSLPHGAQAWQMGEVLEPGAAWQSGPDDDAFFTDDWSGRGRGRRWLGRFALLAMICGLAWALWTQPPWWQRTQGWLSTQAQTLAVWTGLRQAARTGPQESAKLGPWLGASVPPRELSAMVQIPRGWFLLGGGRSGQALQRRRLSTFWIDKQEVSAADYAACVKAGVCSDAKAEIAQKWNDSSLPIVGVSWKQALNYCRFLGKTLPSSAQWEKAARGREGRVFAFAGRRPSCGWAHFGASGACSRVSQPLSLRRKTYDRSPYGVLHLSGNVREWTRGCRDRNGRSSTEAPKACTQREIRGGGWRSPRDDLPASRRQWRAPQQQADDLGFRCVWPG